MSRLRREELPAEQAGVIRDRADRNAKRRTCASLSFLAYNGTKSVASASFYFGPNAAELLSMVNSFVEIKRKITLASQVTF